MTGWTVQFTRSSTLINDNDLNKYCIGIYLSVFACLSGQLGILRPHLVVSVCT